MRNDRHAEKALSIILCFDFTTTHILIIRPQQSY